MKKMMILVMLLLLVGCNNNTTNAPAVNEVDNEPPNMESQELVMETKQAFSDDSLNHYIIDVTLDTEVDTLNGTQEIIYTNNEGIDLTEIYLHLYPNAFTKDQHPSLFDTGKDEINDQFGYVEITSLTVDGEEVAFEEGPVATTMRIPYDFRKDTSHHIKMTYEIGISTTSERFGVVDGIYNLGNWYPILSVYDEDGWNLDPYYSIGDPFYSDMSNYDVTLHLPEDYEVAASGYLNEKQVEEGMKTLSFRADRMRDFAFVISEEMMVMSRELDDKMIYLYYPEKLADNSWLDDSLDFGYETIAFYDEVIGEYPYPNYSVVITNFPSGMEYPGLVFISERYLETATLTRVRNVIVHETVHQWFYSLIGDDEIEEGWIDEGLTSYFTAYFDLKHQEEKDYDKVMAQYKGIINDVGLEHIRVLKSAADVPDWNEYGLIAYFTPAYMYHELYMAYGEEKLLDFARSLYDQYAYGILKEEGIREALEAVYGKEAMPMVNTYLK